MATNQVRNGMAALNKHKKFAIKYIECLNIEESAKACGISVRHAHRLLNNPDVRAFIDEELEKVRNKDLADATEVLKFLTAVMRGEQREEVALTVGIGEGMSEVALIKKDVNQKDRIKAAELLGKAYGIYTNNVDVNSDVQVVFENEKDLED